jgi:hypothetical protein
MVPVKTKVVEKDLFEIIENQYLDLNNDATCIWEYFPGDIVKAESVNDRLIAVELVKSSFPNRKLFQLIFLIVANLGKIHPKLLKGYGHEINILNKTIDLPQRNHPLVKSWLSKYCNELP